MKLLDEKRAIANSLMRKYCQHSENKELAFNFADKTKQLSIIACKIKPQFVWVSKSWVEYLGWDKYELTSTPFTELIHPDDLEASIAAFEYFQRTGKLAYEGSFLNRYRCKDGSYKRILWEDVLETSHTSYMMTAIQLD